MLFEVVWLDDLERRVEVQDDMSRPLEIVDVHGETAALVVEVGHVAPFAVAPPDVVAYVTLKPFRETTRRVGK